MIGRIILTRNRISMIAFGGRMGRIEWPKQNLT